jgi:hypothetical protein
MPAIERAYQNIRNAKTEDVFAFLGMSLVDFHANGKVLLPERVYAGIYRKLTTFNLGADLLVIEFDDIRL